jgi:hypothetical protein
LAISSTTTSWVSKSARSTPASRARSTSRTSPSIRDGQVANRPIYVVLGINCEGERDVLGLWVGTGGEGAKHWMTVLAELRNRGVADVCIVACDGLKGLPEAIGEGPVGIGVLKAVPVQVGPNSA